MTEAIKLIQYLLRTKHYRLTFSPERAESLRQFLSRHSSLPADTLPDSICMSEYSLATDISCPPDSGVHVAALRYYLLIYNRSFPRLARLPHRQKSFNLSNFIKPITNVELGISGPLEPIVMILGVHFRESVHCFPEVICFSCHFFFNCIPFFFSFCFVGWVICFFESAIRAFVLVGAYY